MSKRVRCAIYTRKSTDEGLDQDFNSLDAQREACEAYIRSQKGEGWKPLKTGYDDGGLSGGSLQRPALQNLLSDIDAGKVDLVVVYKVDRLTRSLMDFAKIVESFDARGVSFVSVTQQFNTASSMGRLTLNVLLSFAQFEREVTVERIRDKIAASKKKGMWMGGLPPLGYDVAEKKLVVNKVEAETVRDLFHQYTELGSIRDLKSYADKSGIRTKSRANGTGGKSFSRGHLSQLLRNTIYMGDVQHKGQIYPGRHDGIIQKSLWQAVQDKLDGNINNRWAKGNRKHQSMLAGIAFDETGDRLTPSHACKSGREYRYYISSRLVHQSDIKGGWRIPARTLEQAVIEAVIDYVSGLPLKDPIRWQRDLVDETQHAGIVCSLLQRVDVAKGLLKITVNIDGLRGLVSDMSVFTEPAVIKRVFTIRRRGVEQKVVLEGKEPQAGKDPELIRVISDAYRWSRMLTDGGLTTIRDVAKQEQVDEGDVSRSIKLAFLAPEIVEAVLTGNQPVDLTAEKLKRLSRLPIDWAEQKLALGFVH